MKQFGLSCKKFLRENDKDLPQNDGPLAPSETVEKCEAFCKSVSECDSYVFSPQANMCYTKLNAAQLARVHKPGMVFGFCVNNPTGGR